jgi:integrase
MLRTNSTVPILPAKPETPNRKPAKPNPEYPLYAHASGRWAKKIRGRTHFFGPWADPDGALDKYNRQKADLHAGKTPRTDPAALTLKELCNEFLNHKQDLVGAGELSPLTWSDYKIACAEILASMGKCRLLADVGQDDFARLRNRMAKKWGPHRLNKTIQFVRCVFKYAHESGYIDRPMQFGPRFKRPSKKTIRLHRNKQGPKLLTADEIRKLLEAASTQLKAMTLLGVNAALGNADVGNLQTSHIDFDRGILDYPRVKTGIARRAILWPETIDAIKHALAERPKHKKAEHADLVFITRCGDSWHTGTTDGPLSREFLKLLRKLKINGRKGLGFYSLRHTHRTISDEAKDQPAADLIMGHESPHMSTTYRERIGDERLRAISEYVRQWLFPAPEPNSQAPDVVPFAKQA